MTVRVSNLYAAALRRLAGVALILLAFASSAFAQTTTVTATWDRNTDSDTAGYVVYYGTASGNYQWIYDAGNQVSASLTLSRGFVYFMSVRAYGADRTEGPSSNEASIDLNNGAPTAQIAASLSAPNSAVVSWQTTNAVSVSINGVAVGLNGSTTVPISATTTYTLVAVSASGATATQQVTVRIDPSGVAPVAQISAGLAGNFLAQVSWQTANAVSATINGSPVSLSGTMMVPLTTVSATFTLVATSATGDAATGSASTLLNPGPAVASVSAVPAGASAVLVSWQTGNAVSATLNGVAVPLTGSATVPLSTTTIFTLVAVNAAGAPTTQQVTATLPTGAPTTPRGATASVSGSRITLAWAAPTSGGVPDGYLLYVGTSPGSADVFNGLPIGNVLTVAGDVPPGRYYAALRAANGAGVSDASAVLVIDVGASVPAPSGFAVAWRGATATLSWSPAAGSERPAYYVIEAGTAPGAANVGAIAVGDVTSFEVEVPPGTYYVRLRAVAPSGASLPSGDLVLARP